MAFDICGSHSLGIHGDDFFFYVLGKRILIFLNELWFEFALAVPGNIDSYVTVASVHDAPITRLDSQHLRCSGRQTTLPRWAVNTVVVNCPLSIPARSFTLAGSLNLDMIIAELRGLCSVTSALFLR